MKQVLLLVVTLTLLFSKASAQMSSNGLPWDATYKIPKQETRTIKGEKGKIIVITFISSALADGGIGRIGKISFTKKDAKTDEKLDLLAVGAGTALNYLVRENEELTIESRSSLVIYLSGYIYDVH